MRNGRAALANSRGGERAARMDAAADHTATAAPPSRGAANYGGKRELLASTAPRAVQERDPLLHLERVSLWAGFMERI